MNEIPRKPGKIDDAEVERDASDLDKTVDANRLPGKVQEEAVAMTEELSSHGVKSESITESAFLKNSPWTTVFWLMIAVFFVWLFAKTIITVWVVYTTSKILGSLLALLIFSLFLAVAQAIHKEVKAWVFVDHLDDRKQRIDDSIIDNNLPALHKALEPTLVALRERHPDLMTEFENAASDRETPKGYLKQFENIVLTQLDAEAEKIIKKEVLAGSTMVMISPHPLLDAMAVLWRSKALVTKIGTIYGLKPTGLSSLRLIKHAVTSAAIAASIEELSHLMAARVAENTSVGKSLVVNPLIGNTLKTSFKLLGEGSATAIRLYRLGVITKKTCRPTIC